MRSAVYETLRTSFSWGKAKIPHIVREKEKRDSQDIRLIQDRRLRSLKQEGKRQREEKRKIPGKKIVASYDSYEPKFDTQKE